MTPTRSNHGGLVELLGRVLDKGLVIHADLVISLAGIPLIGVQLRAALAGMETMVRHGLLTAWDAQLRGRELAQPSLKRIPNLGDETVLASMLGAFWSEQGIQGGLWRYGILLITEKRLVLYQSLLEEVILAVALDEIRDVQDTSGKDPASGRRAEISLLLKTGRRLRLRAADMHRLLEGLQKTGAGMSCMTLAA